MQGQVSNQYPNDPTIRQTRSGNNDKLEQLALLARAIGPVAVQPNSSHSPTTMPPPGQLARDPSSAPSGTSGSNHPHTRAVDAENADGSYGTLMVSKGGQSKYLGPTAGSEWLQAVSTLSGYWRLTYSPVPSQKLENCQSRRLSPVLPLLKSRPRSILKMIYPTRIYLQLRSLSVHVLQRSVLENYSPDCHVGRKHGH